MVIINYKEKTLSIVHSQIKDTEEQGFLITAIVAAIRWNSLCDDDGKYNRNRVDTYNVYILTELLETVLAAKDFAAGFTINIKAAAPLEQMRLLYLAIVASVRWNSLVKEKDKRNGDGDNLQVIAQFLEQMSDVKEIK